MSSFLDSVIKFCVSSMIGCNGFPINLLQEQASSSLSAINGLRVLSLLDSRAFFFSPLFFFFFIFWLQLNILLIKRFMVILTNQVWV